MPDTPHPHLTPTVRTDQRVPSRALLVPVPVVQAGNDLHRALDPPLPLGQGRLNRRLHLGKRLRRLHPVIPDALEALRHRVLHHPPDTRLHSDGFMFYPLRSVGAVMIRDPRAIIAIDAPDGDRRAPPLLGPLARHALILPRDCPLLPIGYQAARILPGTPLPQPVSAL